MKTSVVYSRIFLAAMSLSLVILAGCGNTGPQSAKNNPAYDVRQPQIDEAFFALPERTVEIQTVESEATLTGAETEQLSGLSTQTIENRTFLRFEGHPLADYRIQYTTSGEEQQYSDLSLAELTTAFVQDMQVPHPGYTIGAEGLAVKYVVEKETEGEYFVYLTAGSGCGGCSRWFEYVLDVDTQHQRIEVLPVPADSARSYLYTAHAQVQAEEFIPELSSVLFAVSTIAEHPQDLILEDLWLHNLLTGEETYLGTTYQAETRVSCQGLGPEPSFCGFDPKKFEVDEEQGEIRFNLTIGKRTVPAVVFDEKFEEEDQKRIEAIGAVQAQLEAYYLKNNTYPAGTLRLIGGELVCLGEAGFVQEDCAFKKSFSSLVFSELEHYFRFGSFTLDYTFDPEEDVAYEMQSELLVGTGTLSSGAVIARPVGIRSPYELE